MKNGKRSLVKNLKRLYKKLRDNKWFLWLIVSIVAINFQFGFDKQSPYYTIANIGGLIIYMFCISMFFRSINLMQADRYKDIEQASVDFIRTCFVSGSGKIKYFVPYTIDGKWKRIYAKLFSRTHLRIYEATFMDDGRSSMNAFKIVSISKKQLFEMKLRGMIDTENRDHAVQAMKQLGVVWPLP